MSKVGIHDEQELERKDTRAGRRGVRGSANNSSRLAAFKDKRSHGKADWGGCDPARLQTVVVEIGGLGGAVTFGYSRDGGAHFLTLMLDDSRETLWFNGGADLDLELENVIETLRAIRG